MSFDKNSNFNREANFTGVKFGENKPVLEVELNELQEIQNEARADLIRNTIPSGFIKLGELDNTYMENTENALKLKTDSIAYVNGYQINIPKDTIINIGKAPEKEAREDLVFLEVWKEEVTKDSVLTKNGGEGQSTIPNHIQDSRYPIETTRRTALKWRIRHVADVDFNRYHMDGFSAGTNGRNRQVTAQGGSDKPFTPTFDTDATGSFNRSDLLHLNDKGLFVTSQNAELFKTFDGYVYAIPMFKIYRKPSCGKAIPFEYSKINPKVDYDKFTKLIKEDKVERVIQENIKGTSSVCLAYPKETYWNDTSSAVVTNLTKIRDITNETVTVVNNSPYTIAVQTSNLDNSYKAIKGYIQPNSMESFKIDSDEKLRDFVGPHNYNWDKFNMQLLQGFVLSGSKDLYPSLPKYFEGLKSLGEDDGNLITLKNGILSDDTYDINDGNQKLVSFPEVTHVSSTNSLIPKVEANIIKGEESTPLEKLGTKLVTDGTEIVEFTKIKGRTLQNLFGADLPNIQDSASRLQCSNVKNKDMYVSGTYTLVNLSDKMIIPNEYEGSTYIKQLPCQPKSKTLVTLESGRSIQEVIAKYSDGWTSNDLNYLLNSLLILKGDYTTTSLEDLPFVEGIKSVGETENNIINLTSVGKNLISKDMYTNNWFVADSVDVDRHDTTGKLYSIYGIKTFGRKSLTLSCNKPFNRMVFRGKDFGGNIIYQGSLGSENKTSHVFNDIPSEVVTLDLYVHSEGIDYTYDFMLEEGKVVNPYEPYKGYNQNIYLKEPLRSLPNGVCDELVGNKVIRRVGKLVLNGTENWVLNNNDLTTTNRFLLNSNINSVISGDITKYMCNTLPCIIWSQTATLGITVTKGDIFICNKSIGYTVSAIKNWLSDNPTTVYYELATPIEEHLVNVYEKESIKTYQLDAPLRSLPNGVKDEIKDGVLIRRCAEVNLYGLDSEDIRIVESQSYTNSIYFNVYNVLNRKGDTPFLCNNFKYNSKIWYDDVEGVNGDKETLSFRINKNKLTSLDAKGFKTWLQNNPIKVIYELATPVEISLKEVKPQNANFTLQRQFGEGNWLRELPNGVKDDLAVSGKIKRRVNRLVLNGNEDWKISTGGDTVKRFYLVDIGLKNNGDDVVNVWADVPYYTRNEFYDKDLFGISSCLSTSANIKGVVVGVETYKLPSQNVDGFKMWLSENPITILYETETAVEEALSTDNYMSYPCHDFNTYCGSMYVGEGRNYVISDNKMPTKNNIIIETTDFREINGNSKVEDCRYKKNEEGYDNLYVGSRSKNLVLLEEIKHLALTENKGNLWSDKENEISYDETGIITWLNKDTYEWSDLGCIVRVKPNTKYTFSLNIISKTSEGACNLVVAQYSNAPIINGSDANVSTYIGVVKPVSSDTLGARYYTFTTPNNCHYVYCMLSVKAYNTTYTIRDFMLNEGDLIDFEIGIKSSLAFENTESNDIDDLRHQVSLTGFNYDKILNESFDKLLRGEL